jgi:hypothetical protein
MAKELVQKQNEELMALMGQDSGAGMENADREAFAIPFLRVLQKISPQCEEGNAAYIPGAKGGMLLNTVTGKLYNEVTFLPCAFQRRFIQWAPRGTEPSFQGEVLPEVVAEMRADGRVTESEGRLYVGEPNEKKSPRLSDTRSHFGILVDDEGASGVLLSLSSTQIKKSKQLMSLLSAARINGTIPPTWMNKIKITTVLESNDQGSWYGVRFEADGFIDSPELYRLGKDFHDTIMEGKAKADYRHDETPESKF